MNKAEKWTMQVTTIHKFQGVLDISLKILKFIWRHALTLCVLGMLVAAFLIYPSIDWTMFFTEFFIALGLDKLKMSIKSTGTRSNSREQMFRYAQEELDSSRFGSSAWTMNPMQMGSPAWNMNPFATGSAAYYSRQISSGHN